MQREDRDEIYSDTHDHGDYDFHVGLYWRRLFESRRLVRLAGRFRASSFDSYLGVIYATTEVGDDSETFTN